MWNCRWFVGSPPSLSVPPWPRPGLSHTQLHIRPEQTSSRMIVQNYEHCFKLIAWFDWCCLRFSNHLEFPSKFWDLLKLALISGRVLGRRHLYRIQFGWCSKIWQHLVDIHFCHLSLSLGWYQFYWCFAHHSYEDQLLLSLPSNFFPGFQNWVTPQQCCNIKGNCITTCGEFHNLCSPGHMSPPQLLNSHLRHYVGWILIASLCWLNSYHRQVI